jgi:hypothetical protein
VLEREIKEVRESEVLPIKGDKKRGDGNQGQKAFGGQLLVRPYSGD